MVSKDTAADCRKDRREEMAAAFWRGGSVCGSLSERKISCRTSGRISSVFSGYYRKDDGTDGRIDRDGERLFGYLFLQQRETEAEKGWDVLYGAERDLADCLDGTGAGALYL